MSPVKRTHHAVYDLKYHFVWVPKYRKMILREDISKRVEEVFREISKAYEFDIESEGVVGGGECWSDGYFVRSVGDEVTAEGIRRYIEYHDNKQLVFDF